jgi:hypothetical protein
LCGWFFFPCILFGLAKQAFPESLFTLFRHSVGDALDDCRQMVDLVLNINRGSWVWVSWPWAKLRTSSLIYLPDGLTGSFSGFLYNRSGISFDPSD